MRKKTKKRIRKATVQRTKRSNTGNKRTGRVIREPKRLKRAAPRVKGLKEGHQRQKD